MPKLDETLERVRARRKALGEMLSSYSAFDLLEVTSDPKARSQLEGLLWSSNKDFRTWRALRDIEQQLEAAVVSSV